MRKGCPRPCWLTMGWYIEQKAHGDAEHKKEERDEGPEVIPPCLASSESMAQSHKCSQCRH